MVNRLRVTYSVFSEPFDFSRLFLLNVTGWPSLNLLTRFPRKFTVVNILDMIWVFVWKCYFRQWGCDTTFLQWHFTALMFAAFIPLLQIGCERMLFFKLWFITFQRLRELTLFNNLYILFYRLGRRWHWQFNFQLKVFLVILGLKIGNRFLFKAGFRDDSFFTAHLLELQVKLLVADTIKRLLLRFTLEQLW